MRQLIRYQVDSLGHKRVRTIMDWDQPYMIKNPTELMWVYTAPRYDPVYHLRRRGSCLALCGTDVVYCEPSIAHKGISIPAIYCGTCYSLGYNDIIMAELAD